jgi:hypothetical protein
MPIHSAPRTTRPKVRLPFLEAAAIALAGDREAETAVVDRRHAKLMQRFRSRADIAIAGSPS